MSKKTLVIVESPHKGHTIQEFLGDNYIVMASKGHIADLAKGGNNGIGIDIEKNFRPRYVLMPDKIQTINDFLKVAQECKLVILATDPDREGEAIAWHIASRLDGIDTPIKRVMFHEITKPKVLKAIKNLLDIDLNIVHAQEGRRFLDRIVGFTASPFLMNTMKSNLSAGRVQSVVTRLVIDREKEIDSFVPQTFWTAQVSLSNDGVKSFIAKYPKNILDQKTADDIKAKLSTKEYVVKSVVSAEENKGPFAPLITSSLQQVMSKMHSMGADKTMKAAQSLYESGFISYLRTDSTRASDESIQDARQWITDNKYQIPKKPVIYKNKDATQDAHECLRPTDINLLPNNTQIALADERLVYETIWKYFVASQMTPATYSTLKIILNVKGDTSTEVLVSGKALKTKGYLEVLGGASESKIDLPMLNKGDVVNLIGNVPVLIEKKKTQPSARYSEDKLLQELKNRSIGRPATYAELLSKVCTRNYVEKKGNVYHATDLGKKVTETLSNYFNFMDYNYTSELELKLDLIAEGKLNHLDMLKEFYSQFKKELDNAYIKSGAILCEKCGSPMVERTVKNTGQKFHGCSAYPDCRTTKQIESASSV